MRCSYEFARPGLQFASFAMDLKFEFKSDFELLLDVG